MIENFRMGFDALVVKIDDKFSHATLGLILMFAAIPIIVVIKPNYDDNILLGAVVSILVNHFSAQVPSLNERYSRVRTAELTIVKYGAQRWVQHDAIEALASSHA